MPYVEIARPDHWFKNVFMLVGVVLAYFYYMEAGTLSQIGSICMALFVACMVASSNYVINEILDAPTDLDHPVKRHRPIPSGKVNLKIAYLEWIALGVIGLTAAWVVNVPFFLSSLALLVMGLIYNIPPVRTKELPYLDVVSESVNNPIRLMMGWFAVNPGEIPPVSLLVSYWMVGAFFMASKRYAEYRAIGNKGVAMAYRKSFAYYDDNRLLTSMFFYSCGSALLLGVFIIRYHLELILCVPLMAGFFSSYMKVTLKEDSPVQNPEKLYRERGLMLYLCLCLAVFLGLMFAEIPAMYEIFNIKSSRVPPLWRF
ncbi:MAG: UbiA prenyltransferase family protein [Planctomycetaceae bacterium]|nr:UbiA prenyltransferase family protein [Planctomycetaceae bacterium]